jgi:hypothetical protein
MLKLVSELVRHYAKLFQPADGVLHHHPLPREPLVVGFSSQVSSLAFTPRLPLPELRFLNGTNRLNPGVIVLYAIVARIQSQAHITRQPRVAPLEEGVVVSAPPGGMLGRTWGWEAVT